jgi:hypothetical protein
MTASISELEIERRLNEIKLETEMDTTLFKRQVQQKHERDGIGDTMGSSTGEEERAVEAGGWAGTDDATSTAPSDTMGNPGTPEEEKPFHVITRDFEETIQLDEQRQEDDAESADEQTLRMDNADERVT